MNVPAVKMLYLVGIKNALRTTSEFGITTLNDPDQYGLSLVLGGGAVHLIDLTEAYSVLAADGVKHVQSMILQVQDANGNALESYADQSSQVVDPQPVRLINDILSDADARAPLMGASQNLTVFPGYDVALKTGTSNNYTDAWAMGYTPSLVVGVGWKQRQRADAEKWLEHPRRRPDMERLHGSGASPDTRDDVYSAGSDQSNKTDTCRRLRSK